MLRRAAPVVFKARGLMAPVFTPINEDQSVNVGVIPAYAEFLTNNGINQVLVGGTTGEHPSLSVASRKKVIDAWVDAAKKKDIHVQVQVGGAPFPDVLALVEYCESVKVDSILALPELYYKPQTVDALVSYVDLIAKSAPNLPVLYYHIPRISKVEINMPSFVTAATERIPNFKGIKFTSLDLVEGAQVLRVLNDGQEIFLGGDTLIAPAAIIGIKSNIGSPHNLFPTLGKGIVEAVEKGDTEKAYLLQQKLSLAMEAIESEGPRVPSLKAAMELVTGIKVGPPALPQKPISADARERLHEKLKRLDLCK